MVDFDEFIVMREETLEELNIAIEKVIEEKESMGLDYDLLEKVLGTMIKSVRSEEVGPISVVTPIKKYNEEGASVLKKYLEEAKNENFVGALAALGIGLNENGINQLISNMQDRVANMDTEKDRI